MTTRKILLYVVFVSIGAMVTACLVTSIRVSSSAATEKPGQEQTIRRITTSTFDLGTHLPPERVNVDSQRESEQSPNPSIALRDAERCYRVSKFLEGASNAAKLCPDEECLNRAEESLRRAKGLEPDLVDCDVNDVHTSARNFYTRITAAALSGDVDAQICFLSSSVNDERSKEKGEFFTASDIENYKYLAPIFLEKAIIRGDWRAVHLLTTQALDLRSTGLLGYLTSGDPINVYRMNKLLRLGAVGKFALSLDASARADETEELINSPGTYGVISAEQAAEAKVWAQVTYDAYFSHSDKLEDDPLMPCSDSPGS